MSPISVDSPRSGIYEANNQILIYVYNDQILDSFITQFLSLSVVGLYVTVIFAVGQILRVFFEKISTRVIYEEQPNPKFLMDICDGIIIAQMEQDLRSEKDLFNLLVYIL